MEGEVKDNTQVKYYNQSVNINEESKWNYLRSIWKSKNLNSKSIEMSLSNISCDNRIIFYIRHRCGTCNLECLKTYLKRWTWLSNEWTENHWRLCAVQSWKWTVVDNGITFTTGWITSLIKLILKLTPSSEESNVIFRVVVWSFAMLLWWSNRVVIGRERVCENILRDWKVCN